MRSLMERATACQSSPSSAGYAAWACAVVRRPVMDGILMLWQTLSAGLVTGHIELAWAHKAMP
jgi:hypothetical protein